MLSRVVLYDFHLRSTYVLAKIDAIFDWSSYDIVCIRDIFWNLIVIYPRQDGFWFQLDHSFATQLVYYLSEIALPQFQKRCGHSYKQKATNDLMQDVGAGHMRKRPTIYKANINISFNISPILLWCLHSYLANIETILLFKTEKIIDYCFVLFRNEAFSWMRALYLLM